MTNYVVKISKTGEDVKRVLPKNTIMNSNYPSFNVHQEGKFEIYIKQGEVGNMKTLEIPHDLGFSPFYMAWIGGDKQDPTDPESGGWRYLIPYGYYIAYTTEKVLHIDAVMGLDPEWIADKDYDFEGYYFIFSNKVE